MLMHINKPLIDVLSLSIEKWEDQSDYFSEFNSDIKSLNNDISVLRVLMSQYQLKGDDLKNEIGSKSLVSMILNGLICCKISISIFINSCHFSK